jgi:hypothetical protein
MLRAHSGEQAFSEYKTAISLQNPRKARTHGIYSVNGRKSRDSEPQAVAMRPPPPKLVRLGLAPSSRLARSCVAVSDPAIWSCPPRRVASAERRSPGNSRNGDGSPREPDPSGRRQTVDRAMEAPCTEPPCTEAVESESRLSHGWRRPCWSRARAGQPVSPAAGPRR